MSIAPQPILLLHATAGAGHTRAAQAVSAALTRLSGPGHQIVDALDCTSGLTTHEILAKDKPMALVAPIPGQEQRNCDYLLEEGAAVRLHDVGDTAWQVNRWLADERLMQRMRDNALRIARPHAATDVARRLLHALEETRP